jgi:hypothetical protein
MSLAGRNKFEAAATHLWKVFKQDKSRYHKDVTDYIDQESPEGITKVIFAGMPRFLQEEVDKRFVDLDALVDMTRSQIDKD